MIIFLISLYGCQKYDYQHCMGSYSIDRLEKSLGTIPLKDSNLFWISYDTIPKTIFRNNNNGASFEFIRLNEKKTVSHIKTNISLGEYKKDECEKYILYYYYSTLSQSVDFESKFVRYTYSRFNYLKNYKFTDSVFSYQSDEKLYLDLNFNYNYRYRFEIQFPESNYKNCFYYDTLNLGGKTFNKIYQVYVDSAKVDFNYVTPLGFYYTKDYGLIGYYFSNGELWLKD
ncbi:MAG: hypothetical protein ACK4K9_04685 [Bacteroidia bacterium]